MLGVAGARAVYADLERFGIPASRIVLVANARGESAMPAREIDRVVGAKTFAEIPQSHHRGYAKSIAALARALASVPAEVPLANLQPSAASHTGDSPVPLRRVATPRTNGHSTVQIDPKREALKQEVHAALLRQLDLVSASTAHTDAAKLAELRAKVESITGTFAVENKFEGSAEDLAALRKEIVDEALGLGPLEDLMKDPDLTEIMVNGPDTIYVERHGVIERSAKRFSEGRQLRLIIERIITPLGPAH